MKIGFIYCILCPNGKIYIGQTIDYEKRQRSYRNGNFKKQPLLWNDVNKYGYDPHNYMEIIEEIKFDESLIDGESKLDEREIYWIDFYKSYYIENENGLNLTKGGRTRKGYIVSKETREKQRIAKLNNPVKYWCGKKRSPQTVQRMSDSTIGEKHWNYGGGVSEETKKKISESQLGEKHWNYGGNISVETREKISKALAGHKISYIVRENFIKYNENRKRRVMIDTIIYDSIQEAARRLNIQPQTILNRCKNKKFENYQFYISPICGSISK